MSVLFDISAIDMVLRFLCGTPLRLQGLPPFPHKERKATILHSLSQLFTRMSSSDQRHAEEALLCLFIVVCGPESVLPDVLAMHTIEMIPKSMILVTGQTYIIHI